MIYVRSFITAFITCAILVSAPQAALPSYNSEAGHKYAVASQRLADLRKSSKKKRYRSYWVDCIRTFEAVEKKYPKSPNAADACFDRAGLYFELYQFNKYSRDLDSSIQSYKKCQSTYSQHPKAPEALYRSLELSLDFKKNKDAALKTYAGLVQTYPDSEWTGKAKARLGVSDSSNKPKAEIRKTPAKVAAAKKTALPGVVNNVRYWSGGAYTRIVIERDKPIKFLAQELKNPDRLVFDILNSRIDASVNKDPLPVNDGILKQVRVSQNTPDVVRVVLDLASIKSYVAFPLQEPEPSRLVIDVTGEEGKSTDAAVASDVTNTQQEEQAAEELTTEEQTTEEQTTEPKAELKTPSPMTAPPTPPEIKNSERGKLSLSRQMGLKIKTIAIDAGHGGHDPGAIGRSGLKEKNITLDIAKRLAVLVKERLGCNVIMTRDRDVFIRLEDRPAIAKTKGADLFVSIHVNANRRRNARGIETYVQGLRASDKEAMATAARENATTTKTLSNLDSELKKILRGLTKSDDDEESLYLADSVQGSLVNNLRTINRHVGDLKARMKRAFFYVLINTEMPSILAEVGFISNPEEEKLLKNDSYRQAIAEALYRGIKKYVDARSPQMMGT
jgi:N-acetylmuramoyl-L-alanine amidase